MNEIPHPGFDKPEEYETLTTTNSLEEAAKNYAYTGIPDEMKCIVKSVAEQIIKNFIVGAKWDREQMMKEAIPCNVFLHDGSLLLDYTQEQQDNALERIGAHVGDKVKVIIVKEDDHE